MGRLQQNQTKGFNTHNKNITFKTGQCPVMSLLPQAIHGYNEGDGTDTFLRYIEGFVISIYLLW